LKNVEVDARDNENVTPLHWAAIKGHLDIARYLRTCGADAGKQDVRGSTALHWAVTMANYPLASYLANERSLQHLLRVKDAKGNTPKALAPKDKRIFGFMLSKAELPRRLSDSMFKTLWLLVPSTIYLLYFITQWLQFSFVASALVVGLALLLVVYVIRPTFKPTMDCDTLMIGIFYSSASLSVAYWTYYCFAHAAEKVGLLYAYFFVAYVLTMMAIHVYLVHSNPGILKVNRANDAKEFIDEIERGHDPAPVCSSCQTRKPVRCKHDSVTNQCVIRFDHYCVWIFNVVGNDNHLVFMVLLFMCASAHFWSLTSFLPVFFSLLPTPWTWTDLWNLLGYDYMLTYVILFQMLNGFWETLLFIQQSNMVLSNVTMNEIMNWQHYPHFWKGGNAQEFENPFDKGLKNNLKRFISQGRVRDLYHLYRLVTSTEV
jgi:palmitoyltransferase